MSKDTTNTKDTLQQRLKKLRSLHGYNQEYLASYLDISRQAYSHYETGRNAPSASILYKIAKLYSIPPDDLLCYIITTDAVADEYYHTTHSASAYLNDELTEFLAYTSNPDNNKKLKFLNKREKELLFYFQNLPNADQEDIIEFLKIRSKRFHK